MGALTRLQLPTLPLLPPAAHPPHIDSTRNIAGTE